MMGGKDMEAATAAATHLTLVEFQILGRATLQVFPAGAQNLLGLRSHVRPSGLPLEIANEVVPQCVALEGTQHQPVPVVVQGGVDQEIRTVATRLPLGKLSKLESLEIVIIQEFGERHGRPGWIRRPQRPEILRDQRPLKVAHHGLLESGKNFLYSAVC
jgi:hypothetical protein